MKAEDQIKEELRKYALDRHCPLSEAAIIQPPWLLDGAYYVMSTKGIPVYFHVDESSISMYVGDDAYMHRPYNQMINTFVKKYEERRAKRVLQKLRGV